MARGARVRCGRGIGLGLLMSAVLAANLLPALAGEEDGVLLGTIVTRSAPSPVAPAITDWQEALRSEAGDRIFFSDGSADIGGQARTVLAAQAEWLGRHARSAIVIEGHADDAGDAAANQTLALRRAEAVMQRLLDLGVAPDRLAISPRSNEEPIAICSESICSAQNRRVVSIVVMDEEDAGDKLNGIASGFLSSGTGRARALTSWSLQRSFRCVWQTCSRMWLRPSRSGQIEIGNCD
jgi:outer membrane protein OmpA-like peptidoglycan-associated protein